VFGCKFNESKAPRVGGNGEKKKRISGCATFLESFLELLNVLGDLARFNDVVHLASDDVVVLLERNKLTCVATIGSAVAQRRLTTNMRQPVDQPLSFTVNTTIDPGSFLRF
jgi:hypothetical protein